MAQISEHWAEVILLRTSLSQWTTKKYSQRLVTTNKK